MGEAGLVLQRAGHQRVGVDAELGQQAREVRRLQQHADRAGQRRGSGENAIGRHRDHVAGRSGDAAHHRDHRLPGRDMGDGVVQALAAGNAAAGAVDGNDQRLDAAVRGEPVHRRVQLLVVGDEAVHRQLCNIRAFDADAVAMQRDQERRRHRNDGERPPEGQPALEAPSVQDQVGFEGHQATALLPRHDRARPGHPRLGSRPQMNAWMAGTGPAMTRVTRVTPRPSRSPAAPAGCGGGSPRRGYRPATHRNPTNRIPASPASPPPSPCP